MTTSTSLTSINAEEQADLRSRRDEAERVERDLFFRLVRNVPENDGRGRHIAMLAVIGLLARVVAECPATDRDDMIEAAGDALKLAVDAVVAAKQGVAGRAAMARH